MSMNKTESPFKHGLILIVFVALFLFSCDGAIEAEPDDEEEKTERLATIDTSTSEFQKVVGWLGNEELLVHMGSNEGHFLESFNLHTGEATRLFETTKHFLTIEICPLKERIFVQQLKEEGSLFTVFDRAGYPILEIDSPTSNYVTVDWNAGNNDLLFLSYYALGEGVEDEWIDEIIVKKWDLSSNELEELPIDSMNPKWYSRNLYLFIEEERNDLYLGDIRSENPATLISRNVADFYVNNDTFLSITPSDIREDEIFLFYEFPLMVYKGNLTLPKVTMNNELQAPYLTQSRREGDIYAVVPDSPVNLDQEVGLFNLQKLNFEEEEKEDIIELPYNAPINLSPNEKFLLFGWQLETVIHLEEEVSIHSLIQESEGSS